MSSLGARGRRETWDANRVIHCTDLVIDRRSSRYSRHARVVSMTTGLLPSDFREMHTVHLASSLCILKPQLQLEASAVYVSAPRIWRLRTSRRACPCVEPPQTQAHSSAAYSWRMPTNSLPAYKRSAYVYMALTSDSPLNQCSQNGSCHSDGNGIASWSFRKPLGLIGRSHQQTMSLIDICLVTCGFIVVMLSLYT